MSERKINLEEILDKHFHLYTSYGVRNNEGEFMSVVDKEGALEAMKEACHQVLELAAENAEIATELKRNLITDDIDIVRSINKDSILNTINQIE